MRPLKLLAGVVATILLGVATLALALTFIAGSASSQDDYGPRIQKLEERVTLLEATVAALQPDQPAVDGQDRHLQGEIQLVATEGRAWEGVGEGECRGLAQWSHLRPGGVVRITDQAGNLLVDAPITSTIDTDRSCRILFEADLPDSEVYRVEVSANDAITWTVDDLIDQDWDITINRIISG